MAHTWYKVGTYLFSIMEILDLISFYLKGYQMKRRSSTTGGGKLFVTMGDVEKNRGGRLLKMKSYYLPTSLFKATNL